MPLGGLEWEDEEGSSDDYKDRGAHIKVYHYVKHKHRHFKKLKAQHLPGIAGEIFSFLFAFLIAWLFIQGLGWMLGTPTPLVVVESESMVHTSSDWKDWHLANNLNPSNYGFRGGMGIGDIILSKGDNTDDLEVGDVIIYTKYDSQTIGGEPIIHRIVGIVEFRDMRVDETIGAVEYKNNTIMTPCSQSKGYTPRDIGMVYSTETVRELYPDLDLENFRLFITKGDNNVIEDQCISGRIAFPIHEDFVQGRAKFDIPYLGYVKLGIVCAFNAIRGDVCSSRCWWSARNPKC
jgi:signal peptidase I